MPAAPIGEVRADVATREADTLVTQDRQHWAFQTPSGPLLDNPWTISFKLHCKNQLELGPNADRDTLIRRAFFDLIGLPPSVDQWKQWRESTAPNWYELMIDELWPHRDTVKDGGVIGWIWRDTQTQKVESQQIHYVLLLGNIGTM